MAVWPSSLRPPLADGFSETPAQTVVESQADTGTGKTRTRSVAFKSQIALAFQMTTAEYAVFRNFYDNDLAKGALSFQWVHPVTGVTERARISGKYTAAARGSNLWRVSMTFKVIR